MLLKIRLVICFNNRCVQRIKNALHLMRSTKLSNSRQAHKLLHSRQVSYNFKLTSVTFIIRCCWQSLHYGSSKNCASEMFPYHQARLNAAHIPRQSRPIIYDPICFLIWTCAVGYPPPEKLLNPFSVLNHNGFSHHCRSKGA